MENSKFIKFLLVLLGGGIAFSIPLFVFGYDDKTTHPALTKEIIRFFNYNYPELALDAEKIQILMQGSVDEDEEYRWMRHFYDPVYNRGLVLFGDTWESSKDWSQDTLAQAMEDGAFRDNAYGSIFSLFSSSSDYSWERTIYEYAWKDKNRGLEALGHILHLLEDATVPDHTRNDPHAGFFEHWQVLNSSPYEDWTRKFSPENLNSTDLLVLESQKPLSLSNISAYFDKTANYSNNNFFSKDTIVSDIYSKPIMEFQKEEILSDGTVVNFGIGKEIFGNIFHLVKLPHQTSWRDLIINSETSNNLSIIDNDSIILGDYWNLLSKQAVINGAGVVKLFFDEVAREKQTKTLWYKNLSWWQKAWNWFSENVWFWVSSDSNISYTAGVIGSTESTPGYADASAEPGVMTTTDTSTPDDVIAVAASGVYDSLTPSDVGLSTPDAAGAAASGVMTATTSGVATAIQPTPPFIPPMIPGGGGDFVPPVQTEATPSDAEASAALGVLTTTDIIPPDVSLIIQECSDSFSQAGCVIATTTMTIILSSTADDLEGFTLNCQFRNRANQLWQNCDGFPTEFVEVGLPAGSPTSTTPTAPYATSTIFVGSPNTFYEFKAKARDKTGNESQEVVKSVEINSAPIIINEIAWAGTGNSATTSEQEWLELFNRSNSEINLNGWQLKFFKAGEENPETIIDLSGKIAPKAYYLIERDGDDVVSNITADFISPFGNGLNDEGMILKLEKGSTTIDRTSEFCPWERTRPTGWCGGVLFLRVSMERIDPDVSGEAQTNWGNYWEEDIANINKNSEGNSVYGTPRARNMLNYYIAPGQYGGILNYDKTLTKENSPYLIQRAGLNIRDGAVLTIEPGVVIKIMPPNDYWAIVNVYGKIFSQGTAEEPIVFTSIYDDEYAGDTNKDGLCEPANASSTGICPAPGSWRQFTFNPESSGSEFLNTIFRYGGNMDNNLPFERRAMIYITSADIPFKNSRFEYSLLRGLTCINCNAAIENSIFYKNTLEALIIAGSAPKILNNTFLQNGAGIFASDIHGGEVRNNTFDKNGNVIIVESSPPLFGGNTVTEESPGVKGIIIRSGVGGDYSFAKDLSYVIEWGNYMFGGNISAEKGAVFKFMSNTGLTIAESFFSKGTLEEPVVFTSFYDDEFGGDTSNDATSSQPYLGSWRGIEFWGQKEAVFDGVVIRYAGGQDWWYNLAGIKAGGLEPLTIKNSVIEKNKFRGVWISGNASTTIRDTIFRDNHHPEQGGVYPYALLVSDNGTTTISNLIFRNNDIGIGTGSEYHIINNGGIDIDDSNTTKTIPPNLLP